MDIPSPAAAPCYGASAHYGADYFTWQHRHAYIKARVKVRRFAPYVRPTDTVLDFGCAGGELLGGLSAARRIGVEINDTAREVAVREHGIEAYRTLGEVADACADVVVSNHTLEHLASPYEALCQIRPKLKPDGLLVLVLPIDDWRAQRRWNPGDINRHLYTWTPLNLGNLLDEAGFRPQETRVIHRSFMRGLYLFARLPGPVFETLSWLHSHLRHSQDLLMTARA